MIEILEIAFLEINSLDFNFLVSVGIKAILKGSKLVIGKMDQKTIDLFLCSWHKQRLP